MNLDELFVIIRGIRVIPVRCSLQTRPDEAAFNGRLGENLVDFKVSFK